MGIIGSSCWLLGTYIEVGTKGPAYFGTFLIGNRFLSKVRFDISPVALGIALGVIFLPMIFAPVR